MARVPVAAALGLALLFGLAAPARALTRKQATRAALTALKPQKEQTPTGVVVFGLRKPLRARDAVTDAGIPGGAERQTVTVKAIGRRAWLFWEDLAYNVKFTHPSRWILVDDRTGRVLVKKQTGWWPLVDGADPPFITHRGPGDAKYRVFSNWKAPAGPTTPAPVALAAKNTLPADAFKTTCVIALGTNQKNIDGITGYFGGHGATSYTAKDIPLTGTSTQAGSTPDGKDLAAFVKTIAAKCPDIVIYLTGHGSGESVGVGKKSVKVKDSIDPKTHEITYKIQKSDADVDPKDITSILQFNTANTIKVIVDACHAGSFATVDQTAFGKPVMNVNNKPVKNLAVAVTASGTGGGNGYFDVRETTGSAWIFGKDPFTSELIDQLNAAEDQLAGAGGSVSAADVIAKAGDAMKGSNFDAVHLLGKSHVQVADHRADLAPPEPSTPTLPDPPQIFADPIQAYFTQSTFSTVYSINAARGSFPVADNKHTENETLKYEWSIAIPADPDCAQGFHPNSPQANQATWYHADTVEGGPCNHTGNTYDGAHGGHPGTVTVVVSNSVWRCTATYTGSQGPDGQPGGSGPAAQCVKQ